MDITEVLMEERMDFRILNNGSFIPSIGYGTYKQVPKERLNKPLPMHLA